ncbi:MAG: response regulator [Candidatus Margulisiibacteriota bacterium]|nr:MAG: response regulator [Candidatus Margulisiibacteriota bacterium]HAR63055.1 response regulator [Candidatus Margulisiibacteriota bacterium]HCT83860.1 response regulator [Candidatus Margulisiibacteriota bacterium]HCY36760.1 response regulator [Candidatus Margulisiibacteriota bacterium]
MIKKKVLIVDDEVALARMIRLNLEDTDKFEVRTESQGKLALSAALEFKPDIILLDVMIPDLMGSKIAELISACDELKSIPVVFLTAIVKESDLAHRGGTISGYPCLAKPISAEKLIKFIEKVLG